MKATMFLLAAILMGAAPPPIRAEANSNHARDMANNYCAKVAVNITEGISTESDDPPWSEMIRRCEHDATDSICRAAHDMIVEHRKTSPLHCPPPQ